MTIHQSILLAEKKDTDDFEVFDVSEQGESEMLVPTADLSMSQVSTEMELFSKYPYLSLEEEQKLAHDFYHNQNLDSAHKLVLAHMRYVVKIARGYMSYGLPFQDLVHEGALGLMKAVKKFDPYKGVRLVSFAMHWVKAEMQEYILKNWRLVKIATTKAHRKLFFNYRKLAEKREQGEKNHQFHQKVAKILNVDSVDVEEMAQRFHDQEISTDTAFKEDSELTVGDLIPSLDSSPEMVVLDQKQAEILSDRMYIALDALAERDRMIIQSRFFDESPKTLKELADELAISVERVRQLEKKALMSLRQRIEHFDRSAS